MPITYTAKAGDSLCGIAFERGYGNCTALRAEPANSEIINRAEDPCQLRPGDVVTIPDKEEKEVDAGTEEKHKFVKRGRLASIRFVHGSPDRPYASDTTLTHLNVSNFVTNRAGDETAANSFPDENVREFNADGHADVDSFKVEVSDKRASGELDVELEALRPRYNAAGAVTKHEPFPTPRKLAAKAAKQGGTQLFRTSYLRLTTDDEDKQAANAQTLLTSDLHADGDKQVEILDQLVRASYEIPSCPESPKCRTIVELPIGNDRRRIRLAIHILRNRPEANGGTEIVKPDDAEKRLWTWFRRAYAQASIAPKLMSIRVVDPPRNLVAISDTVGTVALGTESLGFRIQADGHPTQVIGPITPAAGATPKQTADQLAALVSAPYQAEVSENAARMDAASDNLKSCDIIITEASGDRVTLDQPQTGALGQTLSIGIVNPLAVPRAPGTHSNVGTIEQRTLYKNFDTGDDLVDVFVCDRIVPNVRGTATLSNHTRNAARATASKYRCSVLMTERTINGTDNNPFTFPHEFGHVAGDIGHTVDDSAGDDLMKFQLMTGTGTSGSNDVEASKRIKDGATPYIGVGDVNLIARIRRESDDLLEDW